MNAPRRKPGSTTSGLVLIDKPQGWTSHDAVARTRRLANTRKVGHAGTLDPMATGLLILGINSSTRLLTYVVGLDKEYLATIRLGAATTTDDAEGEELTRAPAEVVDAVTAEAIAAGIQGLTGDISQRPSAVSAIKVDGKRAYARVRAGEDVELPARPVTVSEFELLSSTPVDGFRDLEVRVVCSSGTYIRALARDLGAGLGVGGHLTSLRRTRIGPFGIDAADPLDRLDVARALIGPADAASRLFGRLDLSEQQAIDLGHGKRIDAPVGTGDAGPIAAISPNGSLIGLVEYRAGQAKSIVNFPPDEPADGPAVSPAVTEDAS
ncbi:MULTISPECIES: tRNA pseudouridine(55) synthase TruB [unclassified Cryobacterium]|uniref:tRNA pseudouridine(55) synthase TruB n=1 Tax=unclassified Cryobacterium TaxID=2649013 RepID=UPI00106A95E3|nr:MULTISPECIES: tRNA pseudouridine(55) synthase TruB [unclassified Cryobacterium]TFC50746.1 tRNA pseudouridine(55) synthase TruB [Cryobacterium sp. TMB3-1-2]TFC73107.1 tRNA pseudouridine(55) synthase TruB [Cryobacterium sp. TMB3-15]TFC73906.1 tRNA pseudouridine(55) synthase TruB [Cryobacterium sp. TMB3-10]TFD45822.1 tRNA pseudouridine(55) synthase TruB [Cryobacterium sp. TMB3-12]